MLWWLVFGAYAGASLVTFVLFAWDKNRAARQGRRVPESVLHTCELLGGWPGALLAMQAVKHKRRKPSYWLVTVAITVLHAAVWVGVYVGGGLVAVERWLVSRSRSGDALVHPRPLDRHQELLEGLE